MKQSRPAKGEYGYRNSHKRIQLAKVGFGAVMILLQLAARGLTADQAVKNILTVMAILSVLPTANVASPLLASWRYRTPPRSFYDRMKVREQDFVILYDLIITSREQILPADAVIVHPTGVYVYCTAAKTDVKKGEQFLNSMLSAHKLDPHAKLILQENAFLQRLNSLKAASQYPDDGSVAYTADLLKNLSM